MASLEATCSTGIGKSRAARAQARETLEACQRPHSSSLRLALHRHSRGAVAERPVELGLRAEAPPHGYTPAVKVCGVTSVEDAQAAVQAGATFIGTILSPGFSRTVQPEAAAEICAAVRAAGAEPVGVFVNESAETIQRVCQQTGLRTCQLHGAAARSALPHLPPDLQVIYVMHASSDGELVTKFPPEEANQQHTPLTRPVEWLLIDGMRAGSGQPYEYSKLKVPVEAAEKGWILAGGLAPSNVATALGQVPILPHIVDVSSGVTQKGGLRKDAAKLRSFVQAVQSGTDQ